MNRDESRRVLELARRLGCTPRDVLLAAARMVDAQESAPADVLAALRGHGVRAQSGSDAAANLLLTPPSAYALGHVEDALATLWGRLQQPVD